MKYVYKESAYIFSIIWCNIELELRCWLIYVYRREKRAVLFLTNKKYFFGTGEEFFFFFVCYLPDNDDHAARVECFFFSFVLCRVPENAFQQLASKKANNKSPGLEIAQREQNKRIGLYSIIMFSFFYYFIFKQKKKKTINN